VISYRYDNDENEIVLPAKKTKQHLATCDIPKRPVFYSQSREDVALYERFYKHPVKCNGTIVEMGALDGKLLSISKFFEDQLKWTSILIEANPNNFQKILNNRPRSRNYNTAICRQKYIEFIGSDAVGGIVNYMSEHHKKAWIGDHEKKLRVPCSRLDYILKDVRQIDIFILDVAGGELEALQTMNWNIEVDYWVIELDKTNSEKDRAVSDLLMLQGYVQTKWDIRTACVKGMDCSSNLMFSKRSAGKRVISYSLYGSNSRYIDGAIANVELMPNIYPDWEIYMYYDKTVPSKTIDKLKSYRFVTMINMTNNSITNKMSWRFLVASDPNIERYVIRDIDSRISRREKLAVDEWIASGKQFHVMRDHPSHSNYAMSGGMWGGTHEAIPNMKSLLLNKTRKHSYLEDMNFLNTMVWTKVKSSVFQHDSFSCGRYGADNPFPTSRSGFEHVGSVYIDKKMRQVDVDILRNAMKHPSKCVAEKQYIRTVMTEDFDTISTVIHKTAEKRIFDIGAFKSILSQCKVLNPSVFLECRRNVTPEWIQAHQPCSNHAFIRMIENGFVSDNRVHDAVPGTIFTDQYIYKWQAYVRKVPVGLPQNWANPPKIWEYECLASVLETYPTAMGHFPHEALPRILYLFEHIPDTCPILAALSPFVQRYIALLPMPLQSRIVKWKGPGHVYYSTNLYIANEGPYCHLQNPHNGGMSTFFQPPLLQRVRAVFVKNNASLINNKDKHILVIKRRAGARSYTEHDLLLKQLDTVGKHVKIFRGNGTLEEHIQLFNWADVVIGPHGAGFSNLVFCKPKTVVIEIGWDGTSTMEMDNMYSRVAAALDLNYRLLIGKGSYGGSISLNPTKVITVLKQA
jgi:FkbM family methyltransferase